MTRTPDRQAHVDFRSPYGGVRSPHNAVADTILDAAVAQGWNGTSIASTGDGSTRVAALRDGRRPG
jgi:hypothetical protein